MTRYARLSVEVSGAITRALDEQCIVGAVVLVAHDGETVFEQASGLANREAGTPMAIASTTGMPKPSVCDGMTSTIASR